MPFMNAKDLPQVISGMCLLKRLPLCSLKIIEEGLNFLVVFASGDKNRSSFIKVNKQLSAPLQGVPRDIVAD